MTFRFLMVSKVLVACACFWGTSAWASNCAKRLNDYAHLDAASIVIRDNRALMVWVPYGDSPGWDFPGGKSKGREFACETAERETCEESGFAVRAVEKVSKNLFRSEIIENKRCSKVVDEGFLKTRWVSFAEVDSLQLRGGTWGDKRRILKQQLKTNHVSDNAELICVFDYDLTLSSHYCPGTTGRPEYHCSDVGPTYGWTEQCLATAAHAAVQRCIREKAKLAVASHSPFDQAKIDALRHTGWPSGAPVLMQPGRNKAEMIGDIKTHYNLPDAKVIFWDDTPSNIVAVAGMDDVFAIEIERGDPHGSNCGIQKQHIQKGWGSVGR